MKNKTFIFSIALFLFVFIIFVSDEQQKVQWKGKIEYEDGVKVIKNPDVPLYGEITFDLEEDLSIGNENSKNYLFYKIRDVGVDYEGNIYVVDMGNYRIQKFDSNGKYLQTIGQYGQGPGDFEQPTKVRIDNQTGNIYIRDLARDIDIFNEDGDYIESVHFNNVLHDFHMVDNKGFYVILWKASNVDLSGMHILGKTTPKGEVSKILAEFPYTAYAKKLSIGATLSVSTGYELALQLAKLDDETFVYGYSKEYELNIINNQGRLLYKIKKDEPYPKFTTDEKEEYKKIPLPEYKPYFFSIFTDSKSRIYLLRNRQTWREPDVDMKVDIFSRDGYFLYEAMLPPYTRVITEGFIYTYVLNEDEGLECVKRYKIKNWEQIREH